MDSYLCEGSDQRCTEPISLTRPEYEAIRTVPIRFAIALNHENAEIDRVLVEKERFATVEKFHGSGAGSPPQPIRVGKGGATRRRRSRRATGSRVPESASVRADEAGRR
jgi:hypothetical protein